MQLAVEGKQQQTGCYSMCVSTRLPTRAGFGFGCVGDVCVCERLVRQKSV